MRGSNNNTLTILGSPSRRRRREEPTTFYEDVYVEQFVYVANGAGTYVVFAVAEKPSYDLIPASKACQLLKNSEVECLSDNLNAFAGTGDDSGTSGFPLWIIYVIAGLIVVAIIVVLFVLRRRRQNKVGILFRDVRCPFDIPPPV